MSKEDFDLLKVTIEAVSDEETKIPNMPVDTFLQEAADLLEWSKDDKEKLTEVGVSAKLFKESSVRIRALRYAQSVWNKDRNTVDDAALAWNKKAPVAIDLKDELENDFRYAFRERQDLLNKVHLIEEGNGNADMVQDLSDLAVLGADNTALLAKIKFDAAKLTTAANTSTEMSGLLAIMNGERNEGNITKKTRDKAYTYLKQGVDEIRAGGRYVFWKDKSKIKGYRSRYLTK
jgi:hypothetical protein